MTMSHIMNSPPYFIRVTGEIHWSSWLPDVKSKYYLR